MIEKIESKFKENIKIHQQAEELIPQIKQAAELSIDAFSSGNKMMLCGNGGSAADAQHIAAELVVRFKKERKAIPAIALSTDASIMTATSNDYWYDLLFARQVEALGDENDVLVGISTSGNSTNVVRAVEKANSKGMKTIGFLGKGGGELKDLVDVAIVVPSDETDRIQEVHIFIGHILCELIESNL